MNGAALMYATKFVAKVSEGDLDRIMDSIERSILSTLGGAGFVEPLVVARRRRMDRPNREKAEESLSNLAHRMVEEARVYDPHDSELEGDLASLKYGLIHGVHGHAHGMIHHHKKNKRPEEFAMLRQEMNDEENRDTVDGLQLDIYAFHSGDASLAADDVDLTGTKTNLPFALSTLNRELEGSLFLEPEAIKYTVFQRTPLGEGRYALQTFVAATSGKRGADPRDVKARIRSLVEDLAEESGADGVLALKSLREGASKGSRWHPDDISQHRGDEPGLESEKEIMGFPDVYELLTLWGSEDEREAAKARTEEMLPGVLDGVEAGYGGFASGFAELASHA